VGGKKSKAEEIWGEGSTFACKGEIREGLGFGKGGLYDLPTFARKGQEKWGSSQRETRSLRGNKGTSPENGDRKHGTPAL